VEDDTQGEMKPEELFDESEDEEEEEDRDEVDGRESKE